MPTPYSSQYGTSTLDAIDVKALDNQWFGNI
jgi:hypothetical protein